MMENELGLIIPKSFNVQLVDENSNQLRLKNVLCHLNIFIDDNSWFSYSFIPTDMHGWIKLSGKDILFNTELKHKEKRQDLYKLEPTKFEFFVLGSDFISVMIEGVQSFISQTDEEITKVLSGIFTDKERIINELQKVKRKQIEDEELYRLLNSSKNRKLIFSEELSKVKGEWVEEIDYEYILKLKR